MTMSEPGGTNTRPGCVVLVADAAASRLMPAAVIAAAEDAVTIVPMSAAVEHATEWDLNVPAVVLGYQAIAEVWNFGSVLPEQIAEVVTELPGTTLEALGHLVRAAAGSAVVPEGLDVGPPVLDDADPRLLFQDAEAEAAHAFWEPTLILAGSLTLGQLVHHRRVELELPAAELEAVGRQAGWIADLERDELDLRADLPAGALAALMRRLQIGASRRLGRIAAWTMEAQVRSAGTAVARKGQSREAAADVPSIEAYVETFLHDLAGPAE